MKPKFQQRLFEEIAGVLHWTMPGEETPAWEQWSLIRFVLANRFEYDNPNFNRDKFLEATMRGIK